MTDDQDRVNRLMGELAAQQAVFNTIYVETKLGLDLEPGSFYLSMMITSAAHMGFPLESLFDSEEAIASTKRIMEMARDGYVAEKSRKPPEEDPT